MDYLIGKLDKKPIGHIRQVNLNMSNLISDFFDWLD
jgi:hypothetical protein